MNLTTSKKRSENYIRQVKGSIIFKGLAFLFSFITIPIMLRYLGQENYGVWATILSIMSWIVFFDLGIGNGLRNRVSEALSNGDSKEARKYISTSYTFIGIILIGIFSIFSTLSFYIPWEIVFNSKSLSQNELVQLVNISAFLILLNFWIGLINQVINAVQKTALVVFGQFLANATALFLVYIFAKYTESSLIYMAFAYGISLIIGNAILSYIFFRKRPDLIPRFSIDIRSLKPLLTLGTQFFFVQLAVLIIFSTDKILITQLFGPEDVSKYDIAFKLFSTITLLHGLISVPLWSSYTDAYNRNDYLWIKKTLKYQLQFMVLIVTSTLLLVLGTRNILKIWIGPHFTVDTSLILSIACFVIISTWSNVFAILLNGIGRIKIQVLTSLIAIFINIPISIFFVKYYGWSVFSVVVGTCLSLSVFAIAGPIKVWKILALKKGKQH